MGKKIIDLIGQRFGKLLVIELVSVNKKKGALWKCKCDCGNTRNILSGKLRSGHTKSCGCTIKEILRAKLKDLTGFRFGKLLVLGSSGERNKWNYMLWRCLCDCGNYINVLGQSLKSGDTQSCGCIRKEEMTSLVGQKIGRLRVMALCGRSERGDAIFKCVCDCGNIKEVLGFNLKRGSNISCGCFHKEDVRRYATKHGYAKHTSINRTYKAWISAKSRCYAEKVHNYKDYGGRGITVCDRWLGEHGFEHFLEDMGECPVNSSLDRINNNGPYSPDNCRWASPEEQANNKRNSKTIHYLEETKTIAQWARFLDMKYATLLSRLKNGWSIERAFTTLVKNKNKS